MKKSFLSSFIRVFNINDSLPRFQKPKIRPQQDIYQVMKDINKSFFKISEENEQN